MIQEDLGSHFLGTWAVLWRTSELIQGLTAAAVEPGGKVLTAGRAGLGAHQMFICSCSLLFLLFLVLCCCIEVAHREVWQAVEYMVGLHRLWAAVSWLELVELYIKELQL